MDQTSLNQQKVGGETGAQYRVWLVTNRHVVDALKSPIIRMEPQVDGPALEIPFVLNGANGNPAWINHPDPEVDVSITALNVEFLRAIGARISFFEETTHAINLSEMQALGISAGYEGYLLGFPLAMISGPTNAVIVRHLCIARIRDSYEGNSKIILIDGAAFPGSSGGAAIVKAENRAVVGTQPLDRSYLIGVIASYVPYIDTAVSAQTGRPRVTFEENSGLTYVFPIDSISETIKYSDELHGVATDQIQVPGGDVE